ncbi:MAG: hypothetical protein BWY85_01746 [Firmicutes bacterium ADurb.Bin506]|nr:MAG: hypothetical protein BWY85_01746 [Firmicutes bacterium ADurb.Bin506]
MAQEDDTLGSKPRDLPANLRADGAASAGDEHSSSGEVSPDALHVEVHGLPSKEIFYFDVAELFDADLAVHQLVNSGQRAYPHLKWFAGIDHAADSSARGRRHGYDDFVYVMFFDKLRNVD